MLAWPETSDEVLAIVPPYAMDTAPAGIAMLNGYLAARGETPLDFVDLRLWSPGVYAPTYRAIGRNAEAYVMDVPDLPLVLELIRAFGGGLSLSPSPGAWFDRFCQDRAIDAVALGTWLSEMDSYLLAASKRLDCSFIGFSVWTSNYFTTLLLAAYLKRKRRAPFIVLGGPQVTESERAASLALKYGLVDAVVPGEGEEAFFQLVTAYRGNRADELTAGSLRWRDGALQRAGRPLLRMTELPTGYFDNMPLMSYQMHYRPNFGLPFQLSRGCTDKCSFCSEWVFWEKFRLARVDQTLDQLQSLVERYDASHFRMVDSLLNGTMRHLRKFAEGLLQRNIEIQWSGFLRADMDDETARLLKRAGFVHAFVGVESLDDETLADMNKRRTADENVRALLTLLENGISVRAGVIPGYPGDSLEGFNRTVTGLLEFRDAYPKLLSAGMEPFIVSPGQPLYKDLEGNGLFGARWPAEITDIVPESADIIGDCLETVSGRNQGKTRKAMLEALAPLDKIENIWPGEAVTSNDLEIVSIGYGLMLVRRKCPVRGLMSYVLTEYELGCLKFLRDGANDVAEAETKSFFDTIEERHEVISTSINVGVACRFAKDPCPEAAFRIGPTSLIRDLEDVLVLLDYGAILGVRLRGEDRSFILDILSGEPRAASSNPEDRDACGKVLAELCRKGILLGAAPPVSQGERCGGADKPPLERWSSAVETHER